MADAGGQESGGEGKDTEEDGGSEDDFYEPHGRRGACSFAYNGKVFLWQGYKGGLVANHPPELQSFELHTATWSTIKTAPVEAPPDREEEEGVPGVNNIPEAISGACCVVMNDRLYSFGGWVSGYRTADIHEFDFHTQIWQLLPPTNPGDGPFLKDKAGIVDYGQEMLCVFGGYGYPSRAHVVGSVFHFQRGATYHWDETSLSSICWTNELHVFHTGKRTWFSPETTGTRPPPCAAFSFTRVDCHRVVLFAGRQRQERVNELHILNMEEWSWSGVILPVRPEEPWPLKRSFHAACALADPSCICCRRDDLSGAALPPWHPEFTGPNLAWLPCPPPLLSPPEKVEEDYGHLEPRLFVLWGMDNRGDPVNDAWVFHVNALVWKQVELPPSLQKGRIWHTVAAIHPSPGEAKVVAFGGCAENLFQRFEVQIPSEADTVIISCGVCSLSEQCLEVVVEHHTELAPFLPRLPGAVQRKVEDCRQRLGNLCHFKTVRL